MLYLVELLSWLAIVHKRLFTVEVALPTVWLLCVTVIVLQVVEFLTMCICFQMLGLFRH